MRPRILMQFVACCGLAFATTGSLRAADQPDGDARLRETLRSTMLQLNDVQSQLASLQASQGASADERKALADKVEQLTKRAADDQAAAAKETEAMKAKLTDQQAEVARLQDSVSQWKAAAEKAVLAARTVAAQRDKAAADAIAMERRAEDLSARNAELFRLGSEILDRYEKFGLGEQFLAREPFVGRARVELENQVDTYEDQLLAQKDNP
jgi:chromosome segregation ATPase